MVKKLLLLVVSISFLTVLTGCGSSYSNQLQGNTWTLSSELDDGIASDASFSEDTMKLKSFGTLEVYTYKIEEKSGNKVITFTPKNLNSDGALLYSIEKDGDKFNLKPRNEEAKKWFGNATLIP
ncbi:MULTISPECIES: hypothetical protein [unclassified Lactococcus]|uniref:hypothetical protein n=1 Tax=unclassified Lactococcus TaxID=2643510 RepID=UPI0011C773E3|nr:MULTISPECIES: hypothetical protein [unclassified Lactococcus]MQW23434.1 hypothetical protein [Lactococcus sp. dk101]TXK37054.1 hypothetical protein FVP42_10030 [Lactococcus sp. dk310]TXK37286.1 hypothetical protein FVP42_09260 [Lactococcus sp. dk310]TXK47718.1 hypothetical protein FVP43_09825 [Lactococcus sp. dk322]